MAAAGYDLEPVLRAVARTTAACLGFATTVINLYRPAWDDFQTVVVEGSEEASRVLLGQTSTAADWAPVLDDRFQRRGAYLIAVRRVRLEPGPADLVHPGGRSGRGSGRLAAPRTRSSCRCARPPATCSASSPSTSRSTAAGRPTSASTCSSASRSTQRSRSSTPSRRPPPTASALLSSTCSRLAAALAEQHTIDEKLDAVCYRHPRRARLPEGVRGRSTSTARARSSCAPWSA